MKYVIGTGKVLISLIILILLFILFSYWRDLTKTKKEILSGKVQYFHSIGWVDWGHAMPNGPDHLVFDLKYSKSDTISYFQDMKINIFYGLRLIVRLTNSYRVQKNIRSEGGVACYILKDVSIDFEALQKSYPYKTVCGIGIGDFNGDKIALIRALNLRYRYELGKPLRAEEALTRFNKLGDEQGLHSLLDDVIPYKIPVKKCGSKLEYIFEYKNNPRKSK